MLRAIFADAEETVTLEQLWSGLRSLLDEQFSFTAIKGIAGAAGLPVFELAHLTQGAGGASKGQLLDAADRLFRALDGPDRERVVRNCIRQMVSQKPVMREALETRLATLGWGLVGEEPHPLTVQLNLDTTSLAPQARQAIGKCLSRFRDGDMDGAVTAICGMLDTMTEGIYSDQERLGHPLGDHKGASYAERVKKAFATHEAGMKARYAGQVAAREIDQLWHWQSKAVQQAAEVLGSYRRNFSDAHGAKAASPAIVQQAIDCAVFVVRAFEACR
ncbi:hypothetical protein [Azospirillum sp. Sh1]|uniref:hypothetical protein n=1 Tax=Azospirillum sp. Sh1 TaxID=2607285 RepID=UPI0011EF3116|nr:hypothetical protein [Azospirillum sp. Sh1]KAA0578211.1 hypothetical protein FZ029_10120 [Azospirillum sp. Sh1]